MSRRRRAAVDSRYRCRPRATGIQVPVASDVGAELIFISSSMVSGRALIVPVMMITSVLLRLAFPRASSNDPRSSSRHRSEQCHGLPPVNPTRPAAPGIDVQHTVAVLAQRPMAVTEDDDARLRAPGVGVRQLMHEVKPGQPLSRIVAQGKPSMPSLSSLLPCTACTARSRATHQGRIPPTSPACTIASTPSNAAATRGSTYPCVSEMTPMSIEE